MTGCSETNTGRDYCWKQAVSTDSNFGVSLPKLQVAEVNTKTPTLVQQADSMSLRQP